MVTFKFILFLLGMFISLYGLGGLIKSMNNMTLLEGGILFFSLVISISVFIGILTGFIKYVV